MMIITKENTKMTNERYITLEVAFSTELGSHIYTTITVHEDYTMNEVVEALRDKGAVAFRLTDSMRTYAKIK